MCVLLLKVRIKTTEHFYDLVMFTFYFNFFIWFLGQGSHRKSSCLSFCYQTLTFTWTDPIEAIINFWRYCFFFFNLGASNSVRELTIVLEASDIFNHSSIFSFNNQFFLGAQHLDNIQGDSIIFQTFLYRHLELS